MPSRGGRTIRARQETMKPTTNPHRKPRSRLFWVPESPRPFEPLAILGGSICLVAHFVAIPASSELAEWGGVMEGELPSWYRTTVWILVASFAVNILALLRIWWRGHSRQGGMLVFYAITTGAWMKLLLGFLRGGGHVNPCLEGFSKPMAQPLFLLAATVYGTLLYGGYSFLTRSRRATHGPQLAAGLLLLLCVAVAGASWTVLTVRSVFVHEVFHSYSEVIPVSTTALPYQDPLGNHTWTQGWVFSLESGEPPVYHALSAYMRIPGLGAIDDRDEEVEYEDGPPRFEYLREWVSEIDSGEVLHIPSMQRWLDNSLFVALRPHQRFEDLVTLLDTCREVFPGRVTVVLLARRRYGRSQGIRAMLTGHEVSALHCIPLETLAIPGAPVVRISFRNSQLLLELNGEPVVDNQELTARLTSNRPDGVNFECHPRVHVAYLVQVLDAIRAAGSARLAIPPTSRGSR
jgi:hypothetical protein